MWLCEAAMLNKTVPVPKGSNDDYPCKNALQEDDTDEYIHDNDESDNSCDSASDDDEDD